MTPVITSWTQAAWIALDILLVALLIYQVLVMIRGTRAVPMLVGLLVVAITFYLARIGELTTLNWVVSNVLPYLVFALITASAPPLISARRDGRPARRAEKRPAAREQPAHTVDEEGELGPGHLPCRLDLAMRRAAPGSGLTPTGHRGCLLPRLPRQLALESSHAPRGCEAGSDRICL